jgi:signal transduction histidine kinase
LALDFNEMTLRLERNEREVRDSSAILAHELRTPLNAAMGRLQGMIDGVFPADPEQLQRVLGRLDLLHRLVDDMHLLSLARAGRLVLNKNRFQLGELIGECLSWVAPQIERCAVRVRRQLTLALVVEADRDRLGQVFSILIDNTLRYAADGGRLNIHVSSDTDRVTIDFSDRGPGIDPEHLPRMFDRFWRAEHSRARHSGGSGLGLSIASAICSTHGGSITAMNRKGGGTTVRVTLPRAWVSVPNSQTADAAARLENPPSPS